jgi:hypothetical protein
LESLASSIYVVAQWATAGSSGEPSTCHYAYCHTDWRMPFDATPQPDPRLATITLIDAR